MNTNEKLLQVELTDILCYIQDAYFYLVYEDNKQTPSYNISRRDVIIKLKEAMDVIYELLPKTKEVYL